MRGPVIVVWQREELVPVEWEKCRIDLGEKPRVAPVVVPCAVCWLMDGDEKDAEKARAWAHLEGQPNPRVYLLPADTSDPMAEAKRRYRLEEGI